MYEKTVPRRFLYLLAFIIAFSLAAMILGSDRAEATTLNNQEAKSHTPGGYDIAQNRDGKSEQTITGELEYSIDLSSDAKSFKLDLSAETNLIYESSDDTIAEVSASGIVTIKKPGAVAIYVTAEENEFYRSAEAVVTVDIDDLGPDSDYDESAPKNGIWSKGIVWNFYEDGTLKIDGAGQIDPADEYLTQILNYKYNVKKLVIGERITRISSYCFYGLDGIESVSIPDSIIYIGQSAFEGCSDLKSVVIPGSVKVIRESAFDWCSSLKTVELLDGVEEIQTRAFYTDAIKSVIIPGSVTKMGSEIFDGNAKLVIKGYSGTKADSYAAKNGIKFWDIDNQTYKVTKAELYSDKTDVKYYKTISFSMEHPYAKSYQIYRKSSSKGKYKKIKEVTAKGDYCQYFLNDKKLQFNKKYYYRVRPYIKANGKKYYGGYSYISVKTKLPKPGFNLSSTVKNGKRYNKVKWTKVSGATGYRVYQYNFKKKKYVLLADRSNRTNYFIHKNIKKGKQYRYIVRAYRKVNGKKILGVPSRPGYIQDGIFGFNA